MTNHKTRNLLIPIGIALGVFYGAVLLVLCIRWLGFDWNLTESAPVGIYRRTQEPLTHGQLVYFCLPTTEAKFGGDRGYIKKVPWWSFLRECPSGFQPLLKHIMAVKGDMIDIDIEHVAINEETVPNTETHSYDSTLRRLPHTRWGHYPMGKGELWVMSTHAPNSWDSRYYGPIHSEQVLGTATPWLVWGTTEAGE